MVTKLAVSGIHVKPNTMKDYMKRASGRGFTYLSNSGLMAHNATISSIIEAEPSIGHEALVRKLAESRIHVTLDTMKHYMKSRVTYLSMSELKAHEAIILSIIDAGFGYKAVVTKLAESGIYVKPQTMKDYMKRGPMKDYH